jgi:hypothetical protein
MDSSTELTNGIYYICPYSIPVYGTPEVRIEHPIVAEVSHDDEGYAYIRTYNKGAWSDKVRVNGDIKSRLGGSPQRARAHAAAWCNLLGKRAIITDGSIFNSNT